MFEDSSVLATDGGVYKCEYTFNVGDAISFEATVGVHCKFIVMSLFEIASTNVTYDNTVKY